MLVQKTFTIQPPPETVFAYLANIENEARWNPWAIEVHKISNGPVGPGARFSGRYKRFGRVEQELSDYVPSRRVTWVSNTMGAASMTFELEPNNTGTRVTMIGRANPPGLMKLIDPVMGLMMRRHFDDLAEGIQRETSRLSLIQPPTPPADKPPAAAPE